MKRKRDLLDHAYGNKDELLVQTTSLNLSYNRTFGLEHNIDTMYIMVPTIPAFSNKVYTLILSCVMFVFMYMLLDDSNFSGINIIQDDIRSELIKKEVKKEVPEDLGDDAAPANGVENFSGVVWEEITPTITEDEIKEQEKSAAIKEKTEDVKNIMIADDGSIKLVKIQI